MFPALAEPPVLVAADPRQSFLSLLPAIEARARTAFRTIRHYHDREDAVAEVVARAWETFAAHPRTTTTAAALATSAVAAVRAALTQPDL
jgi:hypothetical protein